jgi:hypothetical protein
MKHSKSTRTRSLRRAVLASLALAALAAPAVSSGCTGGFAPISQMTGLRVLAVVADKPYANPGDTVTFTMTYEYDPPTPDGGVPEGVLSIDGGLLSIDGGMYSAGGGVPEPLVVWLSGCYNPAGDDYYGCYQQIDFTHLTPGTVGSGSTFSLTLPSGIVTDAGSPSYGLAYVFFAACEGTLTALDGGTSEGTGLAGSFPVGCFDSQGNRLGADSFVPGYTQVYVFKDGRTNTNPVYHGTGLTLDGAELSDGTAPCVTACSIPEDTRLENPGCGHKDPFSACTSYDLAIEVCSDVAELDPSSRGPDGNPLHEVVWVDYFADKGDINSAVLLVNDATSGLQPTANFTTQWIAPPDPGPVNVYAVLHDSRGGETVIHKMLNVQVDCGDAGAPADAGPPMCPGG